MRGENPSNDTQESVKKFIDPQADDLEIFARHRDLFELFTAGRFEVRPPEAGMETFCVDLTPIARGEKAIVYASPVFYEKTGNSSEKAVNSFLHELNHITEIVELLQEESGTKLWQNEQKKKAKSRCLRILDNIQDNVRMDRGILEKAPSQAEIQKKVYREDLYPSGDYTELPRHLQFMQALFRESMIPDEECIVAPEVRAHLNKLKKMKGVSGKKFWDFHTSTKIAPSLRIKLREQILEPIVEELFEQDLAEEKKKQEEQKEKGKKGEPEETGEPVENSGQENEITTAQDGKKSKGEKSESGEPANPEQYFQKWYDEFEQKNPQMALKPEDLQKAIEQAIKLIEEEKKKTPEQKALEAYAKAEGVTVAELQDYQRFYAVLEQIKDPETDETVIEELRAIFRKIIAERMEKKEVPRYPREEGDLLYDPAGAVAASKAGQQDPAVWMTYEKEEERQEKYGAFDITLIGDRSGSMQNGGKSAEQRKAMMLLLEALREFSEELEERKAHLLDDLEVRTEVRTFGDANQNELLKPLGSELTEKQRVLCYQKLADVSGDRTEDYVVLKELLESVSEEDWKMIKEQKLKKIVIVLTDGDSSNSEALKAELRNLREKGVVVVGIGITSAGASAEANYAPNGKICETAASLPVALGELLKGFLKEL